MDQRHEPYVTFEVAIDSLMLTFKHLPPYDATPLLTNGRANYILFENVVAELAGLTTNSQGGASDLVDANGAGYEVKSYRDPAAYPADKWDWFHTAASNTFGPNNNGPRIKKLLEQGDYDAALEICIESGFGKNDYYVYTNTSGYNTSIPLRYTILPTSVVLELLSRNDPRLISRRAILGSAHETRQLR